VHDDQIHSLTELADLAGVTPRTVRYYLAQGLLPSVGQSGPGSKYGTGYLMRLRLIRRLQAEHLPLAEIRRRLDGLDEDQISELAGSDEVAAPSDSALDYLRSVLGASTTRQATSTTRLTSRIPPPIQAQAEPDGPLPAPAPARFAASDVVAEGREEPYVATQAMPGGAPAAVQPIERSQWERIVLAPDVELHIRRPLARAQNKQVDRLVTIARELLEEDRP